MRIPSTLRLHAPVQFPTTDGRSLQFKVKDLYDTSSFECHYEYRLSVEREISEFPTDLVEFHALVPDCDGVVWATKTRCTADTLADYLLYAKSGVLVNEFESGARPYSEAEPEVVEAFNSQLLLERVFACRDDRNYERLMLGGKEYNVQFKYACMVLDVALIHAGLLAVRMREDSLFTLDAETVPAMWRYLDPDLFWRWNSAVLSGEEEEADDDYYLDSQLPLPIVFERAEAEAAPNSGIVVV